MDADWSVQCAADDPIVVIPWRNVTGTVTYIDLRAFPKAIMQIPEAARYPAIATALRRWNQPDSPLYTAKCDVWMYPADLFDAEDLPGFAFAQGSYVDLLLRDPNLFADFPAAEAQLRRWTQTVRNIDLQNARCEWTLRRALIFPPGKHPGYPADVAPVQGFATSLYVWGYGATPESTATAWAAALESLIPLASAAP